MFSGLSAFPLTPTHDGAVDFAAYRRTVSVAALAGADSIGALGSTGSYAYLNRDERAAVARATVTAAGPVPVIVGVGAFSTSSVLEHVEDAAMRWQEPPGYCSPQSRISPSEMQRCTGCSKT